MILQKKEEIVYCINMSLILPIILCFVPLLVLFLILVFGFKMKIVHLLWAMAAGLVCVLPVSLIQYFAGMASFFSNQSLPFILLKSILLYGLVEELCKTGLTFALPHKEYSHFKSLMISFFFGLSLGCFESVIYFLDHFQKAYSASAQLLLGQIFVRMFTADLIHTFCAGLIGLFVCEKRLGNLHIGLIILAVFLHGIYDFFAGFANSFKYFSLAVILFAVIEVRSKYTIYINPEK